MQIPILNGIYTDESPDFRTSYPRNLVPVPKPEGISQGYLRPADGLVQFGTGPGVDRGGVNWNGICYRVMGTKLVSISANGDITVLGDVGDGGQVTFDYSFDRLAIVSGGALYYWNGVLTRVTDADLGYVKDLIWIGGYFMTTDGTSLIVTELTDLTSVNPLKYGSAEADPDPIMGLTKLRNEVYAVNRNTIEVFNNVGGQYFPFQRVDGAQMTRGAVGTFAFAILVEALAFLGGSRNEPPAVWLGSNGTTTKISTREIDLILQEYSEFELAQVLVESRVDRGHQWLYVHLPDQTLVYDAAATAVVGEPVWFTLDSGVLTRTTYRARNLVWCYNSWICGDPTTSIAGYLVDTVSSHYGTDVAWEFGTMIMYNEGNGALFHELELVTLSGRTTPGVDPVIWTSYTIDGEIWSQERPIKAGKIGNRTKRLVWFQQGHMRHWRIQKFRGLSDSNLVISRLEARLEALNA